MDVSEAQRLKALDDENRSPEAPGRRAQPGQKDAEGGDPKKRLELAGLRTDVALVTEQFQVSERRASGQIGAQLRHRKFLWGRAATWLQRSGCCR